MRPLILLFLSILAVSALHAQEPFSQDEALKQLYLKYDSGTQTSQWVCTTEQKRHGMHAGWPCPKQNGTVSVGVLLAAQAQEGKVARTYLVTSAKPVADELGEYACHGCLPAIGIAVFEKQARGWVLESANPAVGFYGGWGDPPGVSLVAVGPQKHGIVLSTDDEAQGFSSSSKYLLLPLGKTVGVAWSIQDENDNLGAVDPEDKLNNDVPYKASAEFRFLAGDEVTNGIGEYYELKVISRGQDREDYGHPIRPENWTAIYRFRDGKYRLLRHTDSDEAKKPPR